MNEELTSKRMDEHWYVMRFLYNRKQDTMLRLEQAHIDTFVPLRYELHTQRGKKVRVGVPVIRDLLFVRASSQALQPILAANDHFQHRYTRSGRQAEYLVVPDEQMNRFIQASKSAEQPLYFTPQELSLSRGTHIRIHGGAFDGIDGIFMKVKGARSKRLVVELPGTLAVAVEVNPDFIEILPGTSPRPE